MTGAQRVFRWLMAAFFGGATVAVSAVIYPEYGLAMRVVFGATMLLYGALAFLSFGLRPDDPRVRVFVGVAVFVALTFLLYPFPPQVPRTVPQALYLLLHTGVFMTMSALLLHLGALLPDESSVRRRHPALVQGAYVVAVILTAAGAFAYANVDRHWISALPADPLAVRANSRETDTVARYGGEELILLLPDTDAVGAVRVGEKLRAAVAGLVTEVDAQATRVTVSVGAAAAREGAEPAQVVSDADTALYCAKGSGKNRVEMHAA